MVDGRVRWTEHQLEMMDSTNIENQVFIYTNC